MRLRAFSAGLVSSLLMMAAPPSSVPAASPDAAPAAPVAGGVHRPVDIPGMRVAGAGPITVRELHRDQPPLGSGLAPADAGRDWPRQVFMTIGTPVFADVNRDGIHEIIVSTLWEGAVYSSSGELWPGWPVDIGGAGEHAAVADLDRDGWVEIIFSGGRPLPSISVFNQQGRPKPGWPVYFDAPNYGNTTCPIVVDLDGDGYLDVGVASETGVHFYHGDGTPLAGWPYCWPLPETNPQWSGPAVGDIDGDGALEVVVGTANRPKWGVYVIRADGSTMPGWPKVLAPVYSSPALADLDNNGDLEIIAQEGDPGDEGNRLWAWHHTGIALPGWPVTIAGLGHSSRCSPAVADIDGDGNLEIVTATSDAKLHVLRVDGTEYPGFPLFAGSENISSPSVIDVDADGLQEIFLTYWRGYRQYVSAWRLDGTQLTGFPKEIHPDTYLNAHASTHVLDMEGDGDLDLVTAGSSPYEALVWVFEIDGSSYEPGVTPHDWPKIRRDMVNTGRYSPYDPSTVTARPPGAGQAPRLLLAGGPNPSTARADVRYRLSAAGHVHLAVFDPQGRRVATLVDGLRSAGPHTVAWDPRVLETGVYLYRLEAAGASATRQVVVAR